LSPSWSMVPSRRPEALRWRRYSLTAVLASIARFSRRVVLPACLAASSYCASFSLMAPRGRARTLPPRPPSRHSMDQVVTPEERSVRGRSQGTWRPPCREADTTSGRGPRRRRKCALCRHLRSRLVRVPRDRGAFGDGSGADSWVCLGRPSTGAGTRRTDLHASAGRCERRRRKPLTVAGLRRRGGIPGRTRTCDPRFRKPPSGMCL